MDTKTDTIRSGYQCFTVPISEYRVVPALQGIVLRENSVKSTILCYSLTVIYGIKLFFNRFDLIFKLTVIAASDLSELYDKVTPDK